jgi:hypothetical protein
LRPAIFLFTSARLRPPTTTIHCSRAAPPQSLCTRTRTKPHNPDPYIHPHPTHHHHHVVHHHHVCLSRQREQGSELGERVPGRDQAGGHLDRPRPDVNTLHPHHGSPRSRREVILPTHTHRCRRRGRAGADTLHTRAGRKEERRVVNHQLDLRHISTRSAVCTTRMRLASARVHWHASHRVRRASKRPIIQLSRFTGSRI